jgi:diguanylate cyclase (GGDEF)-like protein
VHGLLLLDVDHFKHINDAHGHPAGDAVLRQLAQLLLATVRVSDVVARFGGEEFAVLLPELAGPLDAVMTAEKIRQAVESTRFGDVGRVTVSIGVSLATPEDADARRLVERADAALYDAKRGGRNAVVLKAAEPTA